MHKIKISDGIILANLSTNIDLNFPFFLTRFQISAIEIQLVSTTIMLLKMRQFCSVGGAKNFVECFLYASHIRISFSMSSFFCVSQTFTYLNKWKKYFY